MTSLSNAHPTAPRLDKRRAIIDVCHHVPRLLLCLTLASCTFRQSTRDRSNAIAEMPKAARSTPQIRAEEARVGTVRVIGAHRRFVLVETPSVSSAALLPAGQLLHCRAGTAVVPLSTADLRVTGERNQTFVAADVLAGEPHVGDLVFLAGIEGAPPTESAIPISSVLPPLLPTPSTTAPR